MNITLILAAIAACALVLFSFGCTANRPYRTSTATCVTDPPGQDCTDAVIESTPDYKLGFVEFDDQGWFWSAEQLNAVTKMIQDEGRGPSNEARGIIIALFVHGWKNNADFNNTNVVNFRKALRNLKKAEVIQSEQDKRVPRQIVGVYGGWRGLSARIEPFKELSFYERKNTAHKVGGYGALARLLIDLENLQKAANQRIGKNETRTELIIVGHSFGGGALYSALSQIVLERFEQTIEQGHPLKPLGDQVILLNPAFEASRHFNLNKLATSIEKYPDSQRPVLSIFTSEEIGRAHV